jgi:hypothetical protein
MINTVVDEQIRKRRREKEWEEMKAQKLRSRE